MAEPDTVSMNRLVTACWGAANTLYTSPRSTTRPVLITATTMRAMTMLRTVWLTRTGSLSGEPACCVAAVMFVPTLIG